MKKIFTATILTLMMMLMTSGLGLARFGGGFGSGFGGNGGVCQQDGTGVAYICENGTDNTYTGVVESLNLFGSGMVLVLADNSTVTIYGVGPWWYWDSEGIALPQVGDEIIVQAKDVTIDEILKSVAMSISNTTQSTTIDLRAPDTCYPNWKADLSSGFGSRFGGVFGYRSGGNFGGNGGVCQGDGTGVAYICENGTDNTYTGVVESLNLFGSGMVLVLADNSTVTIYGVGSWRYWSTEDIALPQVGDEITVQTKDVTIDDILKSVAMSISNTTQGTTIDLRDPDTCYPNWAGDQWSE